MATAHLELSRTPPCMAAGSLLCAALHIWQGTLALAFEDRRALGTVCEHELKPVEKGLAGWSTERDTESQQLRPPNGMCRRMTLGRRKGKCRGDGSVCPPQTGATCLREHEGCGCRCQHRIPKGQVSCCEGPCCQCTRRPVENSGPRVKSFSPVTEARRRAVWLYNGLDRGYA
ncbi:hypothetical protein BD413DRAFT_102573 [Trametes elegans]|nr:hypothetical protein BD413DRAFT_102573 [Trametes elegans]